MAMQTYTMNENFNTRNGTSPFEKRFGTAAKPTLYAYGQLVYYFPNKSNRDSFGVDKKLDPKLKTGIFLGYDFSCKSPGECKYKLADIREFVGKSLAYDSPAETMRVHRHTVKELSSPPERKFPLKQAYDRCNNTLDGVEGSSYPTFSNEEANRCDLVTFACPATEVPKRKYGKLEKDFFAPPKRPRLPCAYTEHACEQSCST